MTDARITEGLFDLRGRVIFLSGGTGVLGWTYARAFSELGARLVLADLPRCEPRARAAELVAAHGAEVLGVNIDVDDEGAVATAFAAARDRFGAIDVVVNNAARTPQMLAEEGRVDDAYPPFESYPPALWEQLIRTNLGGAFLVARAAGSALADGGCLINVSSIYGMVGPDHAMYEGMDVGSVPAYAAAKAGIHGLTRWLATYWAARGIRVNTVVPGGVYDGHSDEFVARYSRRTPLGRMADRTDLVGVMVFLASDASRYCTGQSFVVDGGYTAW